jgi:hypothetical protein
MKTMKQPNGTPVRVAEKQVNDFLKKGYMYCPKSEWKSKVRDVNKTKSDAAKTEKKAKSKTKSKMTKAERDAIKK